MDATNSKVVAVLLLLEDIASKLPQDPGGGNDRSISVPQQPLMQQRLQSVSHSKPMIKNRVDGGRAVRGSA